MTTTNTNNTTDPYAFVNGNKTDTTQTKKNDELGQNAFLKLMIAQLKNQDPTKPQDPSEFMSQLAQFSQVTSTQSMEKSIAGLTDSLRSTQVFNGTNLMGHQILAPAGKYKIEAGGTVSGSVDAPKGINSLKVIVKDAAGTEVRTFDIKDPVQGLNAFQWDGLTSNGTPAAAGTYSFEVTGSAAGMTGSLDPMLYSKVNSVTIDSTTGSLMLNTNAGAINVNDVRSVL